MTNDFNLTGKVCIVTGAGRGIGRGMAEGLARHGATVVLAGRKFRTGSPSLLAASPFSPNGFLTNLPDVWKHTRGPEGEAISPWT